MHGRRVVATAVSAVSVPMALAAAFLIFAGAGPAAAQTYGYAAGWNAGYVTFGDFASGNEGAAVGLQDGWIVGLQGESWTAGRWLGTRLNVGFTRRPMDNSDTGRKVGVTMADLGLMLRLIPPRQENVFSAFVTGGAGLVHYDFGEGEPVAFPEAGAWFDGRNRARFAYVFGGGIDVITPIRWTGEPIGVRAEVVNHMTRDSPFRDAEGERLDGVNNLRLVIGLFTGFDLFGSR